MRVGMISSESGTEYGCELLGMPETGREFDTQRISFRQLQGEPGNPPTKLCKNSSLLLSTAPTPATASMPFPQ
jgi:hypothetical protein